MKQRSKLLFGNWKMNFTVAQASAFAKKLAAKPIPKGVTVAIFPHSLALSDIATTVRRTGLKVGAQNAYFQDEAHLPCRIIVCRRLRTWHHMFSSVIQSGDMFLVKPMSKLVLRRQRLFAWGITPVLCIGEQLSNDSSCIQSRCEPTNF